MFTHEGPPHIPSLLDYCKKTGTPFSLKNVSKAELPFQPDCVASIYYRFIIKRNVIDACNGRIFNLHPSLLPKYRGCSSLTWAMIDQQPEVGFTFHYVDEGCDTGKILIQKRIAIFPFDNQATVYYRVATAAMEHFDQAVDMVIANAAGEIQGGDSTYFPRGCPFDGHIDPTWPLDKIETFIRAMIHPPYPPAHYKGKPILTLDEFLASHKDST